ncbi:MAG: carbohydrate ABC transporter substrate-binding protein, partial [Brachybacterium sp.]
MAGAGGLLATATLPACTSASGPSLLTLHQSKPEAIPHFSELAAEFTSSQDRFAIQHDIATNLSASFVRNSPPDLGCLNYNLEMGRFMQRGALAD